MKNLTIKTIVKTIADKNHLTTMTFFDEVTSFRKNGQYDVMHWVQLVLEYITDLPSDFAVEFHNFEDYHRSIKIRSGNSQEEGIYYQYIEDGHNAIFNTLQQSREYATQCRLGQVLGGLTGLTC